MKKVYCSECECFRFIPIHTEHCLDCGHPIKKKVA